MFNLKLFILILLIPIQSLLAQTVPKSAKFDEFALPEHSNLVIERGNRFAQFVQKHAKNKKLVIIYYNPRKSTFPFDQGSESASYTKGILVNGYKIPAERILFIDGGFREHATLEFWIIVEGGGFPVPTSAFALSDAVVCPKINVAASGFQHDRKKPLSFSVSIKGDDPRVDLTHRWKTSAGNIVKGQGSSIIEVDLSETDDTRISASVQIEGLAPECNNYDFASTEVGKFPYLYSEIQYNYSYLAALIDGLYLDINNDPALRGHLIFYGPRVGSRNEVATRIAEARKYLVFRGFDTTRLTIVHGGYREVNTVELFLVPDGVDDPRATPTVNEKFVTFTDKLRKRKK